MMARISDIPKERTLCDECYVPVKREEAFMRTICLMCNHLIKKHIVIHGKGYCLAGGCQCNARFRYSEEYNSYRLA